MTLARGCAAARTRFSEYLDGHLTGREMQRISRHLDGCRECAGEFLAEEKLLRVLAALGPVSGTRQEPADMLLRIRVAIAQEKKRQTRDRVAAWKLAWRNSIGPFLFQFSTGLASAVLLLGSVAFMVGLFARPERASAQDEPLGMATSPRLLYEAPAAAQDEQIGTSNGPVVVEAYVNPAGLVYDYRIVSGPSDAQTRSEVEDMLLFSVFEPARFFGQPVRGLAVLSFSGVAVHG